MAIEVKIQRKLNTFELNIDFKSDSKRIGILGASGCGKSMTLKSIAGIEPPESGLIKIEGKTVYDSENKVNLKPQKRNIGYLFQNYALFPTMTVEKNIAAGLKGKKQENAKRVREMIEKFQLTGLEKRFPAELSGGQQQRVALARIMAYKPDVILLDEPFSALDMYLKDRLQQELLELFEDYEGTVIMVSHSRDEVYRFSEELLIIDQGQIVAAGKTKELFQNPQRKEAARLTGCKNFSAVQKMGSHEVYALDWELMLRSEQEVTEDITHVGIRGHWMRPATKAGENTMEVQVEEYIENTFEHQYLFRNKGAAESGTLWWMCQKKNFQETAKDNIPKYLYFPPEHVMLLKK